MFEMFFDTIRTSGNDEDRGIIWQNIPDGEIYSQSDVFFQAAFWYFLYFFIKLAFQEFQICVWLLPAASNYEIPASYTIVLKDAPVTNATKSFPKKIWFFQTLLFRTSIFHWFPESTQRGWSQATGTFQPWGASQTFLLYYRICAVYFDDFVFWKVYFLRFQAVWIIKSKFRAHFRLVLHHFRVTKAQNIVSKSRKIFDIGNVWCLESFWTPGYLSRSKNLDVPGFHSMKSSFFDPTQAQIIKRERENAGESLQSRLIWFPTFLFVCWNLQFIKLHSFPNYSAGSLNGRCVG